MPVKPANQATKIAITDILSKFLSNHAHSKGHLDELHRKVVDAYKGLSPLLSSQLPKILNESGGVQMKDRNLVLYLEPIEKERVLPVITIQSSADWVHFSIYALLAKLNNQSKIRSLAMRFETDEGDYLKEGIIGAHDFCHAQLCNTINESFPVYAPKWLPDSQPSYPLDGEDQVSLVLCMLVSLYGGKEVRAKLNEPGARDLTEHLEKVRALRPLKVGQTN